MGFMTPKVNIPSVASTPSVEEQEATTKAAEETAAKATAEKAAAKKGMLSTIKTGWSGLEEDATTKKKTLLGQ